MSRKGDKFGKLLINITLNSIVHSHYAVYSYAYKTFALKTICNVKMITVDDVIFQNSKYLVIVF